MKNKVGIILCLFLFSCSDFLDENPDNRVALDDLEKASQLLVSAYSTGSPNFTDWMSDDAQFTIGSIKRLTHDQAYLWEDITTGPTEQDSPDFFWFSTYDAIAHANEVLAIIDDLPTLSDSDELRKDAIIGEALLARAYGHFMLVNIFAQHFSNGNDLGIPYVNEPETTFIATYERKSVRKVYDDIEDDLRDGLELIDDSFFKNSGKYHFNKSAALAFASRFYLYKRDYLRSKQYSDQLLGSNPSEFIRDLNSSEFLIARGSSNDYPQIYTSPDNAANLLLMRKISLAHIPSFAYGPESNLYRSLYNSHPFGSLTDRREDPAFERGENAVYPLRYENLFQRSSLNSNVGTPYFIQMSFTGEEVVLNRAEANAFLGNFEEAIIDLQALAEKRFTGGTPNLTIEVLRNFYGDDDDQNNILSYIIFLERRKEFMMQGLRWFDIKRYGFSVTHNLADGSIITLSPDDERKAIQIPQSAIDVGGLKPNPR